MARRTLSSVAALASALSLLLAPVAARADQAGEAVHVVEPGETLSQIADRVGTDAAALARLNNLDDENFLVAGQALKMPVKEVTTPIAPAAARTYTVADGDTLWSIAQQFSTNTAALVDANKLDDPDHLVVGAQLLLPAGAGPGSADTSAGSAGTSTGLAGTSVAPAAGPTAVARLLAATAPIKRSLLVSYTVQPGETLSQIARQFDVRTDAIAQASGLDDPNRLSIGVVLKVPLPGHEHEVKAGETLRDIAAQERVDLGSLIDFNTLDDPELIRVGQVLMVPTPPNLQAATANAAATSAASASSGRGSATGGIAVSSPPRAAVSSAPAPAAPAPASAPAPAAVAQTAKPAAPLAVVAAPRGAPSDGLAGAGLKLLGSPYVWGGSSPVGFDCSGFVWYAAKQIGKQISRGMLGEFNSGAHPARDELKPGDLVFFQNTYSAGLSHNGIYIGNNQFVHAADEAAGVTISSLGTAYWSSHWFGATRVP